MRSTIRAIAVRTQPNGLIAAIAQLGCIIRAETSTIWSIGLTIRCKKDGYPLTGMEMPVKYVAEMLCDRIAACRVYQGDAYTDASAWQYYESGLRVNTIIMHPKSRELLETMLHMLAEKGEEETFAYIRREVLGKKA